MVSDWNGFRDKFAINVRQSNSWSFVRRSVFFGTTHQCSKG